MRSDTVSAKQAVGKSLLLMAVFVVACSDKSGSHATESQNSHSQAGENDSLPEGTLRVTCTEYGAVALPDATVRVERHGEIVLEGKSDESGTFSADVDWDDGPITITLEKEGYTAVTFVGVGEKDARDVKMSIYSKTPLPTHSVSGAVTAGMGGAILVFSSSALPPRARFDGESWSVQGIAGEPLEVAYQVLQDEQFFGAVDYVSTPLSWWRASLPALEKDVTLSEAGQHAGLRKMTTREWTILLDAPRVPTPMMVQAKVFGVSRAGVLGIGISHTLSLVATGEFGLDVTASAEDLDSLEQVSTELTLFASGSVARSVSYVSGAGHDIDLGAVPWVSVPEITEQDVVHMSWHGDADTLTLVGVGAAYDAWVIMVPKGEAALEWPRAPSTVSTELASENAQVYLTSCRVRDEACTDFAVGRPAQYQGPVLMLR
jgi:hypothetical protein